MPNPADTLQIAEVSEYLAGNDLALGALFGQRITPKLNWIIYNERKALEWMLGQNPTYPTLQAVANYVYWLCGKYALAAIQIINKGSGGTAVLPSMATNPTGYWELRINSSFFQTSTTYDDPTIIGYALDIYDNNSQRYLNYPNTPLDFGYTSTGIKFYIDGFDAFNNEYDFIITVKGGGVSSGAPSSANLPVRITVHNQNEIIINWTTDLISRFGYSPTIQLVLYDSDQGGYQESSILPLFIGDATTFTQIKYTGLGANSDGWIVIR